MFIAKNYSTFNEFIFFSEYSVLLKTYLNDMRAFSSGVDANYTKDDGQ